MSDSPVPAGCTGYWLDHPLDPDRYKLGPFIHHELDADPCPVHEAGIIAPAAS